MSTHQKIYDTNRMISQWEHMKSQEKDPVIRSQIAAEIGKLYDRLESLTFESLKST